MPLLLAFRFRGSANWPGVVLGQIKSMIGFEHLILSTTIRPSNHIRVLHSRNPNANKTGTSSPASPQRERSSPQLLATPSFSFKTEAADQTDMKRHTKKDRRTDRRNGPALGGSSSCSSRAPGRLTWMTKWPRKQPRGKWRTNPAASI
jgi:hypothetical protein